MWNLLTYNKLKCFWGRIMVRNIRTSFKTTVFLAMLTCDLNILFFALTSFVMLPPLLWNSCFQTSLGIRIIWGIDSNCWFGISCLGMCRPDGWDAVSHRPDTDLEAPTVLFSNLYVGQLACSQPAASQPMFFEGLSAFALFIPSEMEIHLLSP